jgi:protein O-mannosyl-transferase
MDFLGSKKYLAFVILGIILVFTAIVYSPVKDYEFINLDDDMYVVNNKLIRDVSPEGIVNILFGPNKTKGTRITLLSFAIDYSIDELNPRVYHIHNLILYLLGIVIVFFFIRKLFDRYDIAVLVAVLFAVLATHVESIAWVTERKDMLYLIFYFLSLLAYLKYLDGSKNAIVWIILSFIGFYLSFHSKVAAAPLPIILVLIDYYKKRKLTWKLVLEKVPFFIFLAIYVLRYTSGGAVSSIPGQLDQTQMGEILSPTSAYVFKDKFFLASFALIYYVKMFFYPSPLYFIHPYPLKDNALLPVEYYYSFFSAIILVSFIIILIVKMKSKNKREWIFGLLFFLTNLALYFHFVDIKGIVVVADRYTYVAYVGLIIILSSSILHLLRNKKKLIRFIALPLLVGLYLGLLTQHSIATVNSVKTWKNSETVYTDLLSKNPNVSVAYNNRGIIYLGEEKFDMAIQDFTKAMEIDPKMFYAYNNRGAVYMKKQMYQEALADFQAALQISPADMKAQYNLSKCHLLMRNYHEGLRSYDLLIKEHPEMARAWNDRGKIKNDLTLFANALYDLNKAIELDPNLVEAYNNRGISKASMGDYEGALTDFNKALELDPDFSDAYLNRGNTFIIQQKYSLALEDYNMAIQVDPENGFAYLNRGSCSYELKDYKAACDDWDKALSYGVEQAEDLLTKFCEKKN